MNKQSTARTNLDRTKRNLALLAAALIFSASSTT